MEFLEIIFFGGGGATSKNTLDFASSQKYLTPLLSNVFSLSTLRADRACRAPLSCRQHDLPAEDTKQKRHVREQTTQVQVRRQKRRPDSLCLISPQRLPRKPNPSFSPPVPRLLRFAPAKLSRSEISLKTQRSFNPNHFQSATNRNKPQRTAFTRKPAAINRNHPRRRRNEPQSIKASPSPFLEGRAPRVQKTLNP